MTRRRLLSVTLFGGMCLGAWLMTSAFATWGNDLSVKVGNVVRAWSVRSQTSGSVSSQTSTSSAIDFIECYGCRSLPGAQGYTLGLLALLVGGGPLALLAWRLERRKGGCPRGFAGLCQVALVLQGASVAVGALAMVIFAHPDEVVHWVTLCALADIVAGVPALFAWRRLQGSAFAASRAVLIANR